MQSVARGEAKRPNGKLAETLTKQKQHGVTDLFRHTGIEYVVEQIALSI